jgi:hypothetical protein
MQKPLPKRFTRNDVPAIALTLVSLLFTGLLFGFFMVPYSVQVNFDEGSEAAGVERIISGRWLPYIDAAAIRGPFLYWTQGVVQALTGKFEYTGTRVLALLCGLVVVAATSLSGWAAGWPLAGAIGGAIYIFAVGIAYVPGGGLGVCGESVGIAYVTTAFFLVSYALYRARSERSTIALLALGGFVAGMAGLTKQTEILVCFPMFIWIFMRSFGEPSLASKRARWAMVIKRRLLPFVAGGVVLVALVLLRYALAGELKTFFFWSTAFGMKVYMAPFEGQVSHLMFEWFINEPWAVVSVALALTVTLVRPLSAIAVFSGTGLRAGLRHSAFEIAVGSTALALLIGAALPLRIWPNYFMPVFPFFGLTLGILVERSLARGTSSSWIPQSAAVAVIGGLLAVAGTHHLYSLAGERSRGSWPNPRPDPACTEVDRLAGTAKDPIFVWGTAGDLYVTCQRHSVSMFTSTMIIAGIMPPSWTPEPARVAPGVQELLLRELKASMPPVILDHQMSPGARMINFPIFADFLHERYCRASRVVDLRGSEMTFYARKDLKACSKREP